jgi:hypothetical protein
MILLRLLNNSIIPHLKYKGYMAITTAIILAVVMMLVGISLSFSAFFSRTNGVSHTNKKKTLFAAHGCIEYGLLQLSLDNTYPGNETITLPNENAPLTCTLLPIASSGSNKVVKTTSTVSNITTNLVLIVNAPTLTRVSLQEVKSF